MNPTMTDVTQAAREMVQLWQDVRESGLLEQVRNAAHAADPYLRQAQRAAREAHPPAEDARTSMTAVDEVAKDLGKTLVEHHALMESASRHAEDLRAYVTELEHLWRRLAG
jgi:methyl-accepting chemotaxis protein